jgi:hypothetical protein
MAQECLILWNLKLIYYLTIRHCAIEKICVSSTGSGRLEQYRRDNVGCSGNTANDINASYLKIQSVCTNAGGILERSNLCAINDCTESCCFENILFGFLLMSLWQPSYSYYVRLYSSYCLTCGSSRITIINTDSREMDCREPDTACIYYIPLLSVTSPTIIYIL